MYQSKLPAAVGAAIYRQCSTLSGPFRLEFSPGVVIYFELTVSNSDEFQMRESGKNTEINLITSVAAYNPATSLIKSWQVSPSYGIEAITQRR